jgi:hypothetical protein
MTFQFHALPSERFADLFAIPDDVLAGRGAVRRVVDRAPGFPCRVSLRDAEVGETVLLVHFEHQPAPTPFRASHAIYVRRGAARARPEPGEIPEMLRSRLLSVRAFDGDGMLVDADVAEGRVLESVATRMLGAPSAAYLHVHFARPGCYAARVDRAGP